MSIFPVSKIIFFFSRDSYLDGGGSPVEVQLGVGALVEGVDLKGLGVEVVGLLPLLALERGVALLLLHLELLGFLQK